MSRIFCLCFELNDESIMIQQTRLYRPDCEVIYAFGIKESNLGERFALSSAALSSVVKDNRHLRCYWRGLEVYGQAYF